MGMAAEAILRACVDKRRVLVERRVAPSGRPSSYDADDVIDPTAGFGWWGGCE